MSSQPLLTVTVAGVLFLFAAILFAAIFLGRLPRRSLESPAAALGIVALLGGLAFLVLPGVLAGVNVVERIPARVAATDLVTAGIGGSRSQSSASGQLTGYEIALSSSGDAEIANQIVDTARRELLVILARANIERAYVLGLQTVEDNPGGNIASDLVLRRINVTVTAVGDGTSFTVAGDAELPASNSFPPLEQLRLTRISDRLLAPFNETSTNAAAVTLSDRVAAIVASSLAFDALVAADYDQCADMFSDAIFLMDRVPTVTNAADIGHAGRGACLAAQGKAEESRNSFETAIALNPANVQALLGLGDYHFERAEFDQAGARYSEGRDLILADIQSPDSLITRVYASMGNLALAQADFEGAIAAFDLAIERQPNLPALYLARGTAAAVLGRDQAQSDLRRCLELAETGSSTSMANLADQCRSSLQNSGAVTEERAQQIAASSGVNELFVQPAALPAGPSILEAAASLVPTEAPPPTGTATPVPTWTLAPSATLLPTNTPAPDASSTPQGTPGEEEPTPEEELVETSIPGASPTLEQAAAETAAAVQLGLYRLQVDPDLHSVNLRSGPGITGYFVIVPMLGGENVEPLARDEDGEWYLVRRDDGRIGWVAANVMLPVDDFDLNLIPPASTIPAPSDTLPSVTPLAATDVPPLATAPPAVNPTSPSGGAGSGGLGPPPGDGSDPGPGGGSGSGGSPPSQGGGSGSDPGAPSSP